MVIVEGCALDLVVYGGRFSYLLDWEKGGA